LFLLDANVSNRPKPMFRIATRTTIAVFLASLVSNSAIAFVGHEPGGDAVLEWTTSLIVEAKNKGRGKGHAKGKHGGSGHGNKPRNHWTGPPGNPKGGYVRNWSRKPYYGDFLAGVALGTIIGVIVAGSAPASPSSDLCWYWTDPSLTRGYWDYCD
jgi:hypothetical protein